MSLDFFRVERGLQLDEVTSYLTGNGDPGSSSDTIAVEVGSVYTDIASGSLWTKIAAGAGVDKWQKMASEQYVNNALGATISWLEPAIVNNTTATSVPTGAPGSPIVVDGVSINDGGRVLFSGITGGAGAGVYIYNQTTGGFSVSDNPTSAGDAIYVEQGSNAGRTYVYNGTAWVQIDQASLDEEGFIRTYIGKPSSGNITPTYVSHNFLADGDNLTLSVSKLDDEIGANVAVGSWITPVNSVNENVTSLDRVIGPSFGPTNHLTSLATSTLSANLAVLDALFGASLINGSYVSAGEAAFPAIQAIDIAIGANVSDGNFILSANKIQQNIQALDNELGPNVSNGGTVLAANTINENIQALDTALTDATKLSTAVNVTAATLLDSVSATAFDVVKFFVFVEEAGNPANRYATELYVMTDGTTVDFNKYGTLKLGASIVGLQVSAVMNSGNVSVQVSSTAAVNVKVRRATVI